MKTKFYEWYIENAEKYRGLTSPATAAKLIGISTQHLNRIIETGRIEKLYFEKTPFIGISEINDEIQRREAKKASEEEGIYIFPFIYPQREFKEWSKELNERYKNTLGGAPEEAAEEFFSQKLKEWKKENPERAQKLAERVELQLKGKYDPI